MSEQEIEVVSEELNEAKTEKLDRNKSIPNCGFDAELWNQQYPGLSQDYFTKIKEHYSGEDINVTAINREVLNLAIEVAQTIHSTGIGNWSKKMEQSGDLPFIKYFEDSFEPSGPISSSSETPIADMVEKLIMTKKSYWELSDGQIAFLQWLIIRGSTHRRGKGRVIIVDEQTINQYVLEVLAGKPKFDRSKNHKARFKRFIKVLTDDGYLIRDARLNNSYLINPEYVSTTSTAQAKKQRFEARMALLDAHRRLNVQTIEKILESNKKVGEFEAFLPLVQHRINGMLQFTNIQSIAKKCEITVETKEVIGSDKTVVLKKEIEEFNFIEKETNYAKNIDEIKRQILAIPRLSKKAKSEITKYGLVEISHLMKLSKNEKKQLLQNELSNIGIGRNLRIKAREILENHH